MERVPDTQGKSNNPISLEESSGQLSCPYCGSSFSIKNGKAKRILLEKDRSETIGYLQRRKCKVCHRSWRVYGEGILPYKHYKEEIVRKVVESGEICKDCVAEDSTQHRWLREYLNGKTLMEVQRAIARKLSVVLDYSIRGDRYPLLTSYQNHHRDTWFIRMCIILKTNRLRVGLSPPSS